jgi:uncharacterized protein (DUF302 family)
MVKRVGLTWEQALERIPGLLKDEGFGVLTEIDVQETLKRKLDVDFRPYRILGACNPKFAHAALMQDLEVGLMMPCNVVVYRGDDGKAVVMIVDPMAMAAGNEKLAAVAGETRDSLKRVLEKLE